MMRFLFITVALIAAMPAAHAEFRAAWVATVYNLNFPPKPGLPPEVQQSAALRILDAARAARLNAILLQVRPEGDALYSSQIEPWSRYLTGAQGRAPGYDPLSFFISEAKKRGIEVHAWINPYRAAASAGESRAENHLSRRLPQYVYKIRSVLWMDPGSAEVRRHIITVARDLLKRYDIAGVHLDDYFYPYPPEHGSSTPFPDGGSYSAYRAAGGQLERADWRRENINALIRDLGAAVRATKPGAKFGVSPFGIYTKGQPSDVRAGVDQLHELYSDPVRWIREGWVDYLSPQLYWAEDSPQRFSSLLRWWRSPEVNPRGVPIWPGVAVDRMLSNGWPVSEIARQLAIERSIGPHGGFVLWNIGALVKDTKGVVGVIRAN